MSEKQPEQIMSIQDFDYLDATLNQISEIYVKIDELRTRLERERRLIGNLPSNSNAAIELAAESLKDELKTLIDSNLEKFTYLLRNFSFDFLDYTLRGTRKIYFLDDEELNIVSKRCKALEAIFESQPELHSIVIDAINENLKFSQSRSPESNT